MQRATTSSRGSNDDEYAIDLMQQSPRRRMEAATDLPIYKSRREISRSKDSSTNWVVHLIPLVVFLCLLILWFQSYPVNLEMKDGRIIAIHPIEKPQPVNDTHVDLTILALATPPNTSVPDQTLTADTGTAPQPASETD